MVWLTQPIVAKGTAHLQGLHFGGWGVLEVGLRVIGVTFGLPLFSGKPWGYFFMGRNPAAKGGTLLRDFRRNVGLLV